MYPCLMLRQHIIHVHIYFFREPLFFPFSVNVAFLAKLYFVMTLPQFFASMIVSPLQALTWGKGKLCMHKEG